MRVIWSAASVRLLQEIVDYLKGDSAAGTVTTRGRILETVRRVGQMPYSGRIGRVAGTREAVVPRTPYIAVYDVSAHKVEILGIWHGARQWPDAF